MRLDDYEGKCRVVLGADRAQRIKAATVTSRGDATLTWPDVWALIALGRAAGGGRVVEIGTAWGASAVTLAIAWPGARLLTLDPYGPGAVEGESIPDGPRLMWRLAAACGVARRIAHWGLTSDAAAPLVADGSCRLVWIDGCHTHDQVLRDLVTWWPKLEPGGWLVGHDYSAAYPGVRDAVDAWPPGALATLMPDSSVYWLRKGE